MIAPRLSFNIFWKIIYTPSHSVISLLRLPHQTPCIIDYTKNKKIHQATLPFFSELPIGIRNPNLLKFSKLDQIPRMADHFSDDQFLLYIYTSAHTVECNCDGIHIRYHGYKQCVWVGCLCFLCWLHTHIYGHHCTVTFTWAGLESNCCRILSKLGFVALTALIEFYFCFHWVEIPDKLLWQRTDFNLG